MGTLQKIAGAATVSLLLVGSGALFASAQTTGYAPTNTMSTGSTATTGVSGTGTTSSTPGVPNTGAGGDAAMNIAVLAASAAVALGAGALIKRRVVA